MKQATTEKVCPNNEIAAYIEGELSPSEEFDLDMHFAVCSACKSKLNEQKQLLCALDFALESENEIELPSNFTKIVVTNAESKVSGLRHPQERSKALFICAALFLLVILGLGSETETVLNTFGKLSDQILAIGGFAFHLIYDFAIGAAIILRSISHQIVFNSEVSLALLVILLVSSLFVLSRSVIRYNRT